MYICVYAQCSHNFLELRNIYLKALNTTFFLGHWVQGRNVGVLKTKVPTSHSSTQPPVSPSAHAQMKALIGYKGSHEYLSTRGCSEGSAALTLALVMGHRQGSQIVWPRPSGSSGLKGDHQV